MTGWICPRLAAVTLSACWLSVADPTWASESSHVDGFGIDRRSEDRKRDEIDKRDDAVAKVREPWRNEDLTQKPETESRDLDALSRSIAEQKSPEALSKKLVDSRYEKGNFGIGSGTRRTAEAVGRDWVGADAKIASDKKTMVSADGERVYRPPTMKKGIGRVQANFERIDRESGSVISNAHLDIED